MRHYIRQSKFSTTKAETNLILNVSQNKESLWPYMDSSFRTPIGCSITQHKFIFLFIFQTLLQLTTRSFTINTMQFTVSKNGTQWILDLRPWFSCFERKGSRWKPYNQLPGTSAGSLVFVVVAKTRNSGQSLASNNYHNSQRTENIWNERRSALQCGSTRYRH